MSIDIEQTQKFADQIKKELINSKKPDLGLSEGDVSIKSNKDGSITVNILPGKQLPPYQENFGASVKNISKVLDVHYYDFRKKGWTFTQPINGEFTIAVTKKLNESYTFKRFLLESREGAYENIKEVLIILRENDDNIDVNAVIKLYKSNITEQMKITSLFGFDFDEQDGKFIGDGTLSRVDTKALLEDLEDNKVDYQFDDEKSEDIYKYL